jgi:hypothetical protein
MPAARFLSATIPTSSGAFEAYVAHHEPMLVALKTGTHSPWASRGVKNAGHEVIVANARQVPLIYGSKLMSDLPDGELGYRPAVEFEMASIRACGEIMPAA